MEGTRTSILEEIRTWLASSSQQNIFWLSGSPGAGKTTIAATIFKSLPQDQVVRFFFKRNVTNLSDPWCVWRTIAFQLAQRYDCVGDYLQTFFMKKENSSYFDNSDMMQEFNDLIVASLKLIADNSNTDYPVIILDALDECSIQDKDDRKALFNTIKNWLQVPFTVKLFITSRNDSDIWSVMSSIEQAIQQQKLLTGKVALTDETTISDIHIFFERQFEEIRNHYTYLGDSSKWPGEGTVNKLTTYAAGMFIWAKLVIGFINSAELPRMRLKHILTNLQANTFNDIQAGEATKRINQLYGQILYSVFEGLNPQEVEICQTILGVILCARVPLNLATLKDLLIRRRYVEDEEFIAATLKRAQSILIWSKEGDDEWPIYICHQSLVDFFQHGPDHVKSAVSAYAMGLGLPAISSSFCIDLKEQHGHLAYVTLSLLNDKLKFNICNLPSSCLCNKDVVDLQEQVKVHIPSSLAYSGEYWATHLEEASEGKVNLTRDVAQTFFDKHLLEWFELLSIKNLIHSAVPSLSIVEHRYEVCDIQMSEDG